MRYLKDIDTLIDEDTRCAFERWPHKLRQTTTAMISFILCPQTRRVYSTSMINQRRAASASTASTSWAFCAAATGTSQGAVQIIMIQRPIEDRNVPIRQTSLPAAAPRNTCGAASARLFAAPSAHGTPPAHKPAFAAESTWTSDYIGLWTSSTKLPSPLVARTRSEAHRNIAPALPSRQSGAGISPAYWTWNGHWRGVPPG